MNMGDFKPKLTALMIADVGCYSRLMGEDAREYVGLDLTLQSGSNPVRPTVRPVSPKLSFTTLRASSPLDMSSLVKNRSRTSRSR